MVRNLVNIESNILPPSSRVELFLTDVWEHPLVDENTRLHREAARTKLAELLTRYGADPNSFFTVPIGSLIWNVDELSDFDYQVVFSSKDDQTNLIEKMGEEGLKKFQNELKESNVSIDQYFPMSAELYADLSNCVALLFTPDDYIGGNIEIARQIRKDVIEKLISSGLDESSWQKFAGDQFKLFFSAWEDLELPYALNYKSIKVDPTRSRANRITRKLDQRSALTHNPEEYVKKFLNAKNDIRIPDLETYHRAMIQNNGALKLTQRYPRFADLPNQ